MSAPEFFSPDTMSPPVAAYSHYTRVTAGSELVFIAGQVGLRPDGSLPETVAEQAKETYANIARALAAAGMTPANLVRLNTYLVTGQSVADIRAARMPVLGDIRPASTLIFVPQLVEPKYLIEIDGIAAR